MKRCFLPPESDVEGMILARWSGGVSGTRYLPAGRYIVFPHQFKYMLRQALLITVVALWGTVVEAAAFSSFKAGEVVGSVQFVIAKYQDTLLRLAEEFDLGYEELVAANPELDSWLPGEGNRVLLPKKFIIPKNTTRGIYINLAEYRLYYFPGQKESKVLTFPISIGRGDWATPVGMTRVVSKLVNPAWYPPESIRKEYAEEGDSLPAVVPPGPDNPLGNYALQLNLPGYLIHGTNKPYGLGMKVTHGCIRLHPDNMSLLFGQIPVDTPVRIVWKPFKAGLKDGLIYFEAHPLRSEVEEILEIKGDNPEMQKRYSSELTSTIRDVLQLLHKQDIDGSRSNPEIDWLKLAEIVKRSDGIPYPINIVSEEGTAYTEEITQATRKTLPSTPSGTVWEAERYLF